MRVSGLIDTGAMLALLDRHDAWHARCVKAFESLRVPLATSAAILAELFHLLEPHETDAGWRFVRSGAITVLEISDRDMPDLEELMKRYHDRPMDFADATLVRLARREGFSTIFTVDHNDFETYRIEGTKHFRILPKRSS